VRHVRTTSLVALVALVAAAIGVFAGPGHAAVTGVCPTGWSTVATPAVAPSGRELLQDVTAIADDDVWAVGWQQATSDDWLAPLTEHWNGSTWTRVASPNPGAGTHSQLTKVDASGPSDVWAAGAADVGWTQHWNGSAWTVAPLPATTAVNDLAAAGPGQAWAVGTMIVGNQPVGVVLHWNGSAWAPAITAAPDATFFSAVAASGPNDVWIVGENDHLVTTPFVEHWNGTTWTVMDVGAVLPAGHATFASVSSSGPGDAWILGTKATSPGLVDAAARYTLHWDGSAWSYVPFTEALGLGTNMVVTSVLALGAGNAIAVGALPVNGHAYPFTLRWSGDQWTGEPEPLTNGPAVLSAVDGAPDGTRWAVGSANDGTATFAARRCDGPNGPVLDPVTRIAGPDRIATSVAASMTLPAGTASSVVLTRSDGFADALAGTPLAAATQGPVLLTPSNLGLDARVRQEIQRVLPAGKTVYVLGGPAAVPTSVDATLSSDGFVVRRLQGADRYATAVAIAHDGLGDPSTQLLATGLDFADALAGGAAAAQVPGGAAILLTAGSTVPAPTAAYLGQHPARRFAIGGPAAAAMGDGATAIVGTDRAGTAFQIAVDFFGVPSSVILASGQNFPDALSAGPIAARLQIPILLTGQSVLPEDTGNYLGYLRAPLRSGVVMGGVGAIDDNLLEAIRELLS
jgi:putative cell wall-binding protein